MIKDKNTTIAYHCPQCGISIFNTVNMFSFSAGGNLVKLKCPCGSSELVVNITRDKKFRLNVPCIVCPNSHSYTLSPQVFFERDIFAFSCKFTALNICFLGRSALVMEAMKNNEQELLETFAEYDENFDPETMTELSDIFTWDDELEDFDDEGYEDSLFEELFGGFDENFDFDNEEFREFEELLGISREPGFEIYVNEEFDESQDTGLDSAIYAGFSTYRADESEEKKQELLIEVDNVDDADVKIKNYPVIMQLLNAVAQLVKDKKVICECNNFDGRLTLLDDYLRVGCKNCGSGRDLKACNMPDVQYVEELGELYLDF